MKKVLIIANMFHASPRIPGLAKYLPSCGWKPIILTGSPVEETFGKEFEVIQTHFPEALVSWKKRLHLDPNIGFQKQIGIPFLIRENRLSLTTKLVNTVKAVITYPDEHKSWKYFAIAAANQFLRREKVDAIISSSSPVISHVIANALKSQHKLPWIAELRDPWSQNHNYQYGLLRRTLDKRLELRTLRFADALITVSPVWAEQLQRLHGREVVYEITNGFDPEQINRGAGVTPEFTITYTGNIYVGKQNYELFFVAIRDLLLNSTMQSRDVRVRFYGLQNETIDWTVNKLGLSDVVRQYGEIQRKSSFEMQRESQLLVVFNWNDPREKGVYPTKIFEYLAARRPILLVGGSDNDALQRLLNETKAGMCGRRLEDIKSVLSDLYFEYKHTGEISYNGDMEQIDKYSYRELANKCAGILDTVIRQKEMPQKIFPNG